MTSTQLKVIAIITMFTDHMGAVLFPNIVLFRMIGRLAFPIFAFLLVEGYFHTSNVKKYLMRLGVFALISEVPFDLAFFHLPMAWGHQNIFFTLFLGLLAIWIFDTLKDRQVLLAWGSLFFIAIISAIARTDYDILGLLTMFFFYYYKDDNKRALFSVASLHIVYGILGTGIGTGSFYLMGAMQSLAALSMIFIAMHNGEKGKSLKYVFYAFYPVHLLLLALLNQLVQ